MKNLLYLLILSNKEAFKVGITNSERLYSDRIKNLNKIYTFDLTESYLIEMKTEKLCRTLEKQLHNDYKEYQFNFDTKIDGSTEFLKFDCLDYVLEDIKHKERLSHLGLKITKNIESLKLSEQPKTIYKDLLKPKQKELIINLDNYLDNSSLFNLLENNKKHINYIKYNFSYNYVRFLVIKDEKLFDSLIHHYDDLNKSLNKNMKNYRKYYFRWLELYPTRICINNKFYGYLLLRNINIYSDPKDIKSLDIYNYLNHSNFKQPNKKIINYIEKFLLKT